jgi:hypothetical protein
MKDETTEPHAPAAADKTATSNSATVGYRYDEQHTPPEPQPVSDVAVTTFEHVFEVDSRLMERWVLQQEFPNWDSLRIMNSRHEHLDWMHRHFAERVVTGSELLAEVEAAAQDTEPVAAEAAERATGSQA